MSHKRNSDIHLEILYPDSSGYRRLWLWINDGSKDVV
jgi:hypothetical protein